MANDKEILIKIKALLDGKGFDDLQKKTKESKSAVSGLMNEFKGLLPALGVGAVVGAMTSMTKGALEYANAVDKVADITGVSAEQASRWVIQANHVGTSAETVANGMAILAKNLYSNTAEFEKWGIKVRDNAGNFRDLDDIISQIRTTAQEMGDGAKTTAMEMALLGKSGKELHDFLMVSNDEMERTINLARELGLELNDLSKDKIEQTTRNLNDLKLVSNALGLQITEKVLPPFISFQDRLLKIIATIEELKGQGGVLGMVWNKIAGDASRNAQVTERKWTEANDAINKSNKELTESEIAEIEKRKKKQEEALKEASKKELEHYEEKRKIQQSELEYQRLSDKEKADADKKYWTEVLKNAKLYGDDVKNVQKKVNSEILEKGKATFDGLKESGQDFVAGIRGSYDILGNITNKFASQIGEQLSTAFIGVKAPLESVGLSVGGVFGAIGGSILGAITSWGTHSKTVEQMVEEKFTEMVDKTNEQLDKIDNRESMIGKAVSLVNRVGAGESVSSQVGSAIKSSLGIDVTGMSKADALKALYSYQQTAPTRASILETERSGLASRLSPGGDLAGFDQLVATAGEDYAKHANLGQYSDWRAVKNRLADIDYQLGTERLDAVERSLDIMEKMPKLATGGIVTSPTIAMIGESGAEAIIPLEKSNGAGLGTTIMPGAIVVNGADFNSTAQMKKLADDIASYIVGYSSGTIKPKSGKIRRF
jgi:hypothetical protein